MRNFKVKPRRRVTVAARPVVAASSAQPSKFEQLLRSEAATKALFDHFRNVGISGATFVAGVWAFKFQSKAVVPWAIGLSAWALFVLAFFLFAVNVQDGIRKVRAVKFNPLQYVLIVFFYALAHGALLIYALDSKIGR